MSFYLSVAQKGISSPWESLILSASARYGVPVALIKGIISAESAWNPGAASTGPPRGGRSRRFFAGLLLRRLLGLRVRGRVFLLLVVHRDHHLPEM